MSKKSKFFFWLFVIILSVPVYSDESFKQFSTKSFDEIWTSSPRNHNRIVYITKHLSLALNDMILLPSKKVNASEVDYNVLRIFNYIINGFDFIDNITEHIDKNFSYEIVSHSPKLGSRVSESSEKIMEFLDILEDIELLFNDFKKIESYAEFDVKKLDDFFNQTIKNVEFREKIKLRNFCYFPNATRYYLQSLNNSIFHLYFRALTEKISFPLDCNVWMTKLIDDFYERTLIDILKGYTMIIIGYEFYGVKHQGYDIKSIQQNYYNLYIMTTKKVMYTANEMSALINLSHRSFKTCDPEIWVEEQNYIRVKNYVSDRFQYAKLNVVYTIKENVQKEFECDDYAHYYLVGAVAIDSLRCPEIFEIKPFNCSNLIEKEFSLSGHDYSNSTLSCYKDQTKDVIFNSYCYCDIHSDKLLSVRTLSLRLHTTNAEENRVLTGIRFVVKNNEISIEIQEGKIDFGVIDRNSVRWVTKEGRDPEEGPSTVKLSFRFRSFDLDDIDLPVGYFVTGVRFRLLEHDHIGLVVRGTHMWDDSGLDTPWHHRWFYPTTSPRDPREKIYIKDCRNSAEVTVENHEISRPGAHYVDLSVGILSNNFKNLPVIPFFDSQNVESQSPAPLGGLGLFYKGQYGYGGFLAFKLIASRYSYNFYSDLIYYNSIKA